MYKNIFVRSVSPKALSKMNTPYYASFSNVNGGGIFNYISANNVIYAWDPAESTEQQLKQVKKTYTTQLQYQSGSRATADTNDATLYLNGGYYEYMLDDFHKSTVVGSGDITANTAGSLTQVISINTSLNNTNSVMSVIGPFILRYRTSMKQLQGQFRIGTMYHTLSTDANIANQVMNTWGVLTLSYVSGSPRLYLNGVQVGINANDGVWTKTGTLSPITDANIVGYSGTSQNFSGKIGPTIYHKTGLSSSEVAVLYSQLKAYARDRNLSYK